MRREQTPLAAREINMSQNHWSKRKWRMLYNQDPRERRVDTSWGLLLSLCLFFPSFPFLFYPLLPSCPSLPLLLFFLPPPHLLSLPPNLYPLIQSNPQVLQIHCSDDLQVKATMVLSISTFGGKTSSFPVDLTGAINAHLKWVCIQDSWIVSSVLHVHTHWVGGKDRGSVGGGIKRKIASGRREGEEWQADSDQSKSNPQRFKGQT